jgi:hypothetical protein
MARACSTCQHLKRPEIDRPLAAGEPEAHVARDYKINPSSLNRHRTNCLKLGSSNHACYIQRAGRKAMIQDPRHSVEALSFKQFSR